MTFVLIIFISRLNKYELYLFFMNNHMHIKKFQVSLGRHGAHETRTVQHRRIIRPWITMDTTDIF